MKQYKLILFLFFLSLAFIAHPFAASFYDELKYEKCDCTNNKFTKHLTEPYKKEIEEWFIQTASPEEQKTEAGATCIDCGQPEPSEDKGFWTSVGEVFSMWWERIKRIRIWGKKSETQPLPLPHHGRAKTDFIPPVCFQMSGEMTDEKPTSKTDFFTCIHKHYDGSDVDKMCVDTVAKKADSPKKCLAIPISCEDTKDPSISCAVKFKNRDDNVHPNGCNRGSTFPRRPCLNEEYTAMTAKAFHDVAKCLDIDPELAFPILHHESRFLLNNESSTGALCHAQVTGNAIADFNSFLEEKPNYPALKQLLPKNIEKNCPAKWKHFKKVGTKYNEKRKRFELKSDRERCKLNLNPYTCFFYGLSYIKILMHLVDNAVQKRNQIEISYRGNQTFIFKNEKEKRKAEKKLKEKLKTRKIKIFQDEDNLKRAMYMIGYNGGTSIPITVFRDFMLNLKKDLSNKQNRTLRQRLLKGWLNNSFFTNDFNQFIRRNYPSRSKSRKKEVSNYLDSVNNDINHLNQNIQSKYPGSFTQDTCPR